MKCTTPLEIELGPAWEAFSFYHVQLPHLTHSGFGPVILMQAASTETSSMLEAHHVPVGDAPAAGGSSEPVDPACAPSPPTVTGATTTSDFATAFLSKYDDDEDPGAASGGFVVRVIGPRGMNAMRSANLQVSGWGGGGPVTSPVPHHPPL